MYAVVRTAAAHKAVIIAPIAQRRLHLQIGQPPVAILIVQVVLPILQKDAQRANRLFVDERGIGVTAPDIGEGTYVREDLAKRTPGAPMPP